MSTLEGYHWIDGSKVLSNDRGEIDHVNPATGRVQGAIPNGSQRDVDDAVGAARDVAPAWAQWRAGARRDVLWRIADLLEAHADELRELGIRENGTPVSFATQVTSSSPAGWFRYYAGWVDKLDGRVTPSINPGPDVFDYNVPEPYGVVAVLTAFNAPMSFVGMKVAAALAAGNTVVIKPSELAPFTTSRFGAICAEAGLPDGVVNVLHGDGVTGDALARHPGVNKITFTGSGATATKIMTAAAVNLTPVSFELGGKSANLVFEDADITAAVALTVQRSIGLQTGQACLAPTRLLVQRSVYHQAVEEAAKATQALVVGDPTDPRTMVGPVISDVHCQRILNIIESARGTAGRLVAGGERMAGDLRDGYFISPAVFADVDRSSSLARAEVFGPVLSMLPFEEEDEAIEIANSTDLGLAAYAFTNDHRRAHRLARRLEAGHVNLNTIGFPTPNAPFGGTKRSGFGREGGYDGLLEMTRSKRVQMALD